MVTREQEKDRAFKFIGRGEDTRKGFSDHLYRALELAGIHTFRDGDEIERGANIAAELHKAIQESRVAIIVFSNDYASSRWCLDELVNIMQRRRTNGYVVVPVFYKVDPSVVRWQTGSFAEAFTKHERRFKDEMDKVDEWRKALKDVADLGGMVLGDEYESQLIQNIVNDIGKKLDPITLNVAPHAVGIDDRVEGLNIWLREVSDDVGVAGIYGMGGIGKTTIAKAAYNLNMDRFEGSSFLADVRATSEQPNGLFRLQRKLISDIQKGKVDKIYSMDKGASKIKNVVCCKRVLIVLDDVHDSDQFNAILDMRKLFYPGSKIIITTRDEQLLKANEVSVMFQVPELDMQESLQLFSWHAFRQAHPIESYLEVSTLVVQHCEGLPLALQVLGSSLFGQSVGVCWSTLEKLTVIPHGKVQKILRISYDYLQDDHDKSLFLHVACFFVGKKNSITETVLDSLCFFTISGLQNLVDRCLLKIIDDKLVMHQLIRDMGRGIVCQESPDPGKRSRVTHKDAYDVLKNSSGTETIIGLSLNLSILMEGISSKAILGKCARIFKPEAFGRMHNLQILLLHNVKLSGGFGNFPKNLTWVSWERFPMESIPDDLYLRNIVVLELQHSILQLVWRGTKFLPRLKVLDLSHSHNLIRTPDFSGLTNLERLILKDCLNIVEVDESIGELQELVSLNLKGCKNLIKLPRRISILRSLRELILSGCSKLGDTKKLGLLSNTPWKSISMWISPRKSLKSTSFSLANLPASLGSLSLAGCNISEISNDLNILSSLKYLDVSENPILSLPENIKSLIMLDSLHLGDCSMLKMLPELPPSLRTLQAEGCTSLRKITNLPNLFISLQPFLSYCNELTEVETLFTIKPLRSIDIQMIKDIDLYNFESVERIEVEMSNHMTDTTRIGPLQGLYECGIFSIFLHGSSIPDWYSYRSMGVSISSFSVPFDPKLKIRGFNVCALYALGSYRKHPTSHQIKVSNETKGLMWTYVPVTVGVPKEDGLMLWLSHWLFENHEFESGDEVNVSLHCGLVLDFPDGIDVLPTKEFGIQIVYEQENKDYLTIQHEAPYWSYDVINGNGLLSASKYQMWVGKYLLCNYMHNMHHFYSQICKENPAHLDFSYEPKYCWRGLGRLSGFCHHLFEHAILSQEKVKILEMYEGAPGT